jgi:peptidoglycan/xylan/chitin deacetylase (PgdA/CDA1 family)
MNNLLKSSIKNFYFNALSLSGKLRGWKSSETLVLNYHHILPSNMVDQSLLFGYSHSIESFESQIQFLIDNYANSIEFSSPNSFVVSFDDCSESAVKYALPILRKHNIRAYFFINEACIGEELWIDTYFKWLSWVPFGRYRLINEEHNIQDETDRFRLNQVIWKKLMNGLLVNSVISEMNDCYNFSKLQEKSIEHSARLKVIDQTRIELLKSEGHLIGAHSQHHYPLTSLKEPKQIETETDTRNKSIYNTSVFAIPFGSASDYNDPIIQVLENKYTAILLNHSKPMDDTRIYGRLNFSNTSNHSILKSEIKRHNTPN